MGGIEERINVTGADQSAQAFDKVADAQERVGESAEDAGKKSEKAGGEIGSLDGIMDRVKDGAMSMIAGFAGMDGVKRLFTEFLNILKDIDELQKRFAEGAVTLSDASASVSAQTGLSEKESIKLVSEAAEKGGISFGAAGSLIKTFDIVMGDVKDEAGLGGVRNAANRELAVGFAPFAGAKDLNAADVEQILVFLSTNQKLKTVEMMQLALAQFERTSSASLASTVGAFGRQLNVNAAGLVGAGVPYEDQLAIGAYAIGANAGNLSRAAMAGQDLVTLASGSQPKLTKHIDTIAQGRGIDPSQMSRGQRIALIKEYIGGLDTKEKEDLFFSMVSPEIAVRVFQALGPETIAAYSGAAGQAATATIADYAKPVAQYKTSARFKSASDEARQNLEDAMLGLEFFAFQQAKRNAERVSERKRAKGEYGFFGDLGSSDESLIEREMYATLVQRMVSLKAAGVDVSAAEKARRSLLPNGETSGDPQFGFYFGLPDEKLAALAGEVQKATNIYITNVGNQYQDNVPGRLPQPDVDLSE